MRAVLGLLWVVACEAAPVMLGYGSIDGILYKTPDILTGAVSKVTTNISPYSAYVSTDPAGTYIMIADKYNGLSLLTLSTGTITTMISGVQLQTVCVSPDASFALVYDYSRVLSIVNIATWQMTAITGSTGVYDAPKDGVGTAATIPLLSDLMISPDGTFAIFISQSNANVRKYTFATQTFSTIPGTFTSPQGVDIYQDGSYALVSNYGSGGTGIIQKIMIGSGTVSTVVTGLSRNTVLRFYPDYTKAYVNYYNPSNAGQNLIVITIPSFQVSYINVGGGVLGYPILYFSMTFYNPSVPCVNGSTYSATGKSPCTACSTSICSLGYYASVACTTTTNAACSSCTSGEHL